MQIKVGANSQLTPHHRICMWRWESAKCKKLELRALQAIEQKPHHWGNGFHPPACEIPRKRNQVFRVTPEFRIGSFLEGTENVRTQKNLWTCAVTCLQIFHFENTVSSRLLIWSCRRFLPPANYSSEWASSLGSRECQHWNDVSFHTAM